MTSRASHGSSGSAASSSRVNTDKHETSFQHFKSDIDTHFKNLVGSFHKGGDIRTAPLPPDKTPKNKIDVKVATNTAPQSTNFLSRGFHDVENRLKDIVSDIGNHQLVNATTDVLLLPTHMMEDQIWKPVAGKATHIIAEAGPTVLKATVGPLVVGGVVVIAVAIFIFASYKELNHAVDHALS